MAEALITIASVVPKGKDKTMREPHRKEMRREEPKRKEEPKHKAHHEAYMRGHKDGKMGKPANPGDPERKAGGKGDGMREATREKPGTERGRPEKGKQPSLKSDGMKTAMRGEAGKMSKLSPMKAAEMRVR